MLIKEPEYNHDFVNLLFYILALPAEPEVLPGVRGEKEIGDFGILEDSCRETGPGREFNAGAAGAVYGDLFSRYLDVFPGSQYRSW